MVLPCGHTACQGCIAKMGTKMDHICPSCQTEWLVPVLIYSLRDIISAAIIISCQYLVREMVVNYASDSKDIQVRTIKLIFFSPFLVLATSF